MQYGWSLNHQYQSMICSNILIIPLLFSLLMVFFFRQAKQGFQESSVWASINFGPDFITINSHDMTHIVKDVQQKGPSWTHSAFTIENTCGALKNGKLYNLFINVELALFVKLIVLKLVMELHGFKNQWLFFG